MLIFQHIDESGIEAEYFKQNLTEDSFKFYDSAERNQEVHKWGIGQYFTLLFVSFFIICIIIGSFIENNEEAIRTSRMKSFKKFASESDDNLENDFFRELNKVKKPLWKRYFLCFSLMENAKKLICGRNTDADQNLACLNGIRVLSMGWVILCHTFLYLMQSPLNNPLEPLNLFKIVSFSIITSGPYVVDIFFWMTGFLGVYLMLGTMKEKEGNMPHPGFVYLHRYLRLIPVYVISMMLYWQVLPVVGDGPVFYELKERASACDTWFWTHFLFINNIVPWDYTVSCMGWTWYLANDFQFFFFFIPLFVWLFYHKRRFGLLIILSIQAFSYVLNFSLAYVYKLEPSYFRMTEDYFAHYYYKPYNRLGPFVIGCFVGL